MARHFDIAVLRAFVAAAERSSITAAANALALTQGAVSQQIRRLESDIATRLFDRERSGVRLTAAGERFLGKARQLLAIHDELWAQMAPSPAGGRLQVGVPFDLARTCIEGALKPFAARHPSVELSLTCSTSPELLAALADGRIDLALVEAPADESRGESLAVEPLVWVGARSGRAHARSPLPVSLAGETCAFRPVLVNALRGQGRSWRPVFEDSGLETAMASVQADLAVTASLQSWVPPDFSILADEAGLPALPEFSICLHQSPGRPSRAAGEMAQALRALFRPGRPVPA